MFTGIIEEIGTVREIRRGARSSTLTIEGRIVFGDLKIGDSIAVNGVCLTVTSCMGGAGNAHSVGNVLGVGGAGNVGAVGGIGGSGGVGNACGVGGVGNVGARGACGTFTADVMRETLHRSSIGSLKAGSQVNLERALSATGRFGGHFVQGHIDGTGVIEKVKKDDNAIIYVIKTPDGVMRLIVEKGSIAVDGISLTVTTAATDYFGVSVIPHTAKSTTLSDKIAGDIVNLETDLIGKYVEKLLLHGQGRGTKLANGISREFLLSHGYD